MGTTNMSASFFAFILVVLIQGNSEAAPARDDDGVPSGSLHPISGVVPVSVPKVIETANQILKDLRAKIDKNHVSQLDTSLRNEIVLDALTPPECHDNYGISDGTLKHLIRGTRDIVAAVINDVQGLGQGIVKGLPLVPNVINGISETITYALCGVEDAVSDLAGGFDAGSDIATQVLVDLIQFQGPAPLANIPAGAVNFTKVLGKIGAKIVHDLVTDIKEGLEDLAAEVESGVTEVVKDVEGVVSGVETDVTSVVNAVDTAAQMIGGGVKSGVGNIVGGIKGGLGSVIKAL